MASITPKLKIVSSEYYNLFWPFILKKEPHMQNDMAFFLHVWLQTQPTWDFLTLSLHCLGKGAKGPNVR